MSPASPQPPTPSAPSSPLWTWTNPACGLFEFATLEDLKSAVTAGRIPPEAPVWRNAPGCQSVPASFTTMPWTLHRPGAPAVKLDLASLQERHLAGALPPGAKLGQQGNILPELIFGPVSARA
jgi:hypothetical protein